MSLRLAAGSDTSRGSSLVPFYESIFLVRPDVSSQQVEALANSFSDDIAENGGKVSKVELWGLRNLTYRIKKNRKAHYVLFNIDAPAPAIESLEQSMRMSEDVLRSLTTRVTELEEGPSPMMQNKGRDDRSRRDRRNREDGSEQDSTGAKDSGHDATENESSGEGDSSVDTVSEGGADKSEVEAIE